MMADCCLCEYTDHGHCGVMKDELLQNDETLVLLQKIAISYAEAGVDSVAPSGMVDGMVQALRGSLDSEGYSSILILSYAIKYASHFYGPFRDAAGSSDVFKGDRKSHQLSSTQRLEALREADLDESEGADFLMVKPALTYMDMIRDLKNQTALPVVSYNVSGEYAMFKEAAKSGIINEWDAFHEYFIGLVRAGSDFVVSYYAIEYLKKCQ